MRQKITVTPSTPRGPHPTCDALVQHRPRLRVLVATFVLILISISGCSRIQLAYNTASFTIELFAGRYLGLDDRQIAAWRPILANAIDRHRDEELPAITKLLAQAAQDVDTGLTDAKVSAWIGQIEPIYQRHARLFADAAAPLLVTLSTQQIAALGKKFAEQAREDAPNDSPERRLRKRTERYIENVEWATGDLTESQRALVAEEVAKLPDASVSWYAYRDQQREKLVALLERGADEEQIRGFLTRWLVDFKGMPADLLQARDTIRAGLIRLSVRLDATLSEAQRQHFEHRLRMLSEDFQSLQRRGPTQAPGV